MQRSPESRITLNHELSESSSEAYYSAIGSFIFIYIQFDSSFDSMTYSMYSI